jgi:phosphoribosylanthranilate isomerase
MRIKICCIQDYHEIELALKYGATEVGLVGNMPSGPGPISDKAIRMLTERSNHLINTVLLTSQNDAQGIIRHHEKVKSTAIQIVRELPVSEIEKVKSALPDVELFQVVHVTDETAIERAGSYASVADVILLDSGNPKADVYGGTGETHNWEISRMLIKAVDKPVFLAGGLNSQNVQNAIQQVRPSGVDICSGLRIDGRLVEAKLISFSDQIKLSS